MKILFLSSGNNTTNTGISPIIESQGKSLIKFGVDIQYFTIKGKGFKGYLKNRKRLKHQVKERSYDIIHAHYSLSGFLASLTFTKTPIVVSLMGSDIQMNKFWRFLIKINLKLFWSRIIVKSEKMKNHLALDKKVDVIPNGVNLDVFYPIEASVARNKLNWDHSRKYILFAANPNRYEKNFTLFQKAFTTLNTENIEFKVLQNVNHEDIPLMMNASDVIALSSKWEGSPNVIKEALACNRPIVSTDVGDVSWLLDSCKGCFISDSDYSDYAQKLSNALSFKNSHGRERIRDLNLDDKDIAKKLIKIYKELKQE